MTRRRRPAGEYVYDIETADWTRPYLAVARSVDGSWSRVWRGPDCVRELAREMCERGGRWYAHNGGYFDAIFVLDVLGVEKVAARMQGARILSARIGAAELVDSWGLLPLPLRSLGEIVGAPKLALEAYDAPETPEQWAHAIEYCERDCEVLALAIQWVRGALADAGHDRPDRALTIGGSAWRIVHKRHGAPDARRRPIGQWRMARSAYYGGRCEVARIYAPAAWEHDINSAYPWAMTSPLPILARAVSSHEAARALEREDVDGAIVADVTVPESLAPPLPVRIGGRLCFPWGPLRGAWTATELRAALARGARIERVRGGCLGACSPWARPFVEHCWSRRAASAAKAESTWWKLLANALSGRLAIGLEQYALMRVPRAELWLGPGDTILAERGDYYWIVRERVSLSGSSWPEAAAVITSRARVRLLEAIEDAGADWCYSDTDSVYATRCVRDSSPDLGQWKVEGPHAPWHAVAPKVYTIGNKHRAKGIPSSAIDGAPEPGRVYAWERGIQSIRMAMRADSLVQIRRGHRELRPTPGWVGGRIGPDDEGRTRAPSIEELMARH